MERHRKKPKKEMKISIEMQKARKVTDDWLRSVEPSLCLGIAETTIDAAAPEAAGTATASPTEYSSKRD